MDLESLKNSLPKEQYKKEALKLVNQLRAKNKYQEEKENEPTYADLIQEIKRLQIQVENLSKVIREKESEIRRLRKPFFLRF